MNILLVIWLFLFDSGSGSVSGFSKEQLEPFFCKLHDSFLSQSLFDPISEEVLLKLTFFTDHLPLETLKAIDNIHNREFSYFFGKLKSYSTIRSNQRPFIPFTRHIEIHDAFILFNSILNQFLDRNIDKKYAVPGWAQMITELIISILKQIDYSDKKIFMKIRGLKYALISTKDYINMLQTAVRLFDPEADTARGFEYAFSLLRGLAIEFKGKIPTQPQERIRVYSLLFVCDYYAISLYNFRPRSLEIETVDPLALSFLLRLRLYTDTERGLFFLCRSKNIVSDVMRKFDRFAKVKNFFSGYGSDTFCKSLRIHCMEMGNAIWEFRIHLRLAKFCSQTKKNLNIIQ
jgi:hypothetical protein